MARIGNRTKWVTTHERKKKKERRKEKQKRSNFCVSLKLLYLHAFRLPFSLLSLLCGIRNAYQKGEVNIDVCWTNGSGLQSMRERVREKKNLYRFHFEPPSSLRTSMRTCCLARLSVNLPYLLVNKPAAGWVYEQRVPRHCMRSYAALYATNSLQTPVLVHATTPT